MSTDAPTPAAPRQRLGGAILVAIGIFVSRIFGLVRVRVFSHYFGLASDAADAFNAGLQIPNLLQNLFGEGALSASFIPVYAQVHARATSEEADRWPARWPASSRSPVVGHRARRRPCRAVAHRPDCAGFDGEKRELSPSRSCGSCFPGAGLLVDVRVVPRDPQQPPPVLPVLRRAGRVEPGDDRGARRRSAGRSTSAGWPSCSRGRRWRGAACSSPCSCPSSQRLLALVQAVARRAPRSHVRDVDPQLLAGLLQPGRRADQRLHRPGRRAACCRPAP